MNPTNSAKATNFLAHYCQSKNWAPDNCAALLLFTCEDLVKRQLALLRNTKDGLVKIAELLVAMLVVCNRLGNSLRQGLTSIINYSFNHLYLESGEKSQLIREFWNQVGLRLDNDIGSDILAQLGEYKLVWSTCKNLNLFSSL